MAPAPADDPARAGLTVDPDTLLSELEDLDAQITARQARTVRLVHAFVTARTRADRHLPGFTLDRAGRVAIRELAAARTVSPTTVFHQVAEADALVRDFPHLLAAMETGRTSLAAARKVLSETQLLSHAHAREVDRRLADQTNDHPLTPGRMGRAAAHLALAVDPDLAARREAHARRQRALSVTDKHDGTATLWARLRAEEAVAIWDALDNQARGMRHDGDPRSLNDLMCDTLCQRITGTEFPPEPCVPDPVDDPADDPADDPRPQPVSDPAVDPAGGSHHPDHTGPQPAVAPDADPGDQHYSDHGHHDGYHGYDEDDSAPDAPPATHPPAAPRPAGHSAPAPPGRPVARPQLELQVVIAASTLLGLDHNPAMLRGYGTISPDLARRLADTHDTTIRRLICDPLDGRLLAMDPRRRRYRGGSRRFLLWREDACREPGCDRPPHDTDHIEAYANGGPTTLANGHGVCLPGHHTKEHPQVRVEPLAPPAPPAERPGESERASDAGSKLQQLHDLRDNAPTLRWTMPTGRTYDSRPPPVLGWGSQPPRPRPPQSGAADDERPPPPDPEADIDSDPGPPPDDLPPPARFGHAA